MPRTDRVISVGDTIWDPFLFFAALMFVWIGVFFAGIAAIRRFYRGDSDAKD